MALRDPTLEELYAGSSRALPAEIQQLGQEDTACTFCGVSYFVFAEVQALQATAKKYKKAFHDFVRFLERERRVAQELREHVEALKSQYAQLVYDCRSALEGVKLEVKGAKDAHRQDLERLELAQASVRETKASLMKVEQEARRADQEARASRALMEQKMRNEILHLSSQIEKCKLDSSMQVTQLMDELEKAQSAIQSKEAELQEQQAKWTAAERQAITERDGLKQKLLAMNERVETERETARQLEAQLTVIKTELGRVVAASAAEQSASAQLNSELIQLKRQLQNAEKSTAHALAERARIGESNDQQQSELQSLRRLVDQRAIELAAAAEKSNKIKENYIFELERTRKEHGEHISSLQRGHLRAMNELKQTQTEYLECLRRETTEQRCQIEKTSQEAVMRLEEQISAERDDTKHCKVLIDQITLELETERQHSLQRTLLMGQEIKNLEHECLELRSSNDRLKHEVERQQSQFHDTLEGLQTAHMQDRHQLERQVIELQSRVKGLESQLEDDPRAPQTAWQQKGSKKGGVGCISNNQDNEEVDKTVAMLRQALEQKDKEIVLLQQTVHRECLERTSLLEKLRSGKILPDLCQPSIRSNESSFVHRSSVHPSICDGESEIEVPDRENSVPEPKASFYEKLRGRKKPKPRKS